MTAASDFDTRPARLGWFRRTEAWLDARGKGAWIALMVVSFVLFWPVGLLVLFYMLTNQKFSGGTCAKPRNRWADHDARFGQSHGFRPSGNTAFDAYKADTLKRLMDEQEQFEAFLERLRKAKDKQEFDAFMDERASRAPDADEDEGEADVTLEADGTVVQPEPKAKA